MAVKYQITDHALRRFSERFGYIDSPIECLLENSLIFGGQKGSQYLLLNQKHQIVFPVVCCQEAKDHVVKTVLTLDQAKANLSLCYNVEFSNDISERIEKIREEASKPKPKPPTTKRKVPEELVGKLKEFARKFIAKHGWYFPDKKETKELFAQAKIELNISRGLFDDYVLTEIGRIIRERNNKSQIVQ